MQFVRNWRNARLTSRVNRIEGQVVKINNRIAALEAEMFEGDLYAEAELHGLYLIRKSLWLRRSELVKQLPPVYQEDK